MDFFESEGIKLAYLDEGEGEPILLIHGFASNLRVNWVSPGWVRALVADGRRVIALDNRGHGDSDKPHDRSAYGLEIMAGDALRLLDHLRVDRADIMGYSMGARIATTLAGRHPERVRSVIIGGLGSSLVKSMGNAEEIARALEAPSLESVASPAARPFRAFAEQTRSDLAALAACIRETRQPVPPDLIARIRCMVMIAVGTRDEVAGSAAELAPLFESAEVLDIPGRDHMQAVGDKVHKQGVLAFLRRRP